MVEYVLYRQFSSDIECGHVVWKEIMELTFERGDRSAPKGHGFIYFRSSTDQQAVLATYVVVLPLELDLSKYVPPMFAGSLAGMQMQTPSAIPVPPIPERMENLDSIERLAEARDDDVVFGGQVHAPGPEYLLTTTGEAVQEYVSLYSSYIQSLAEPAEEIEPPQIEDAYARLDESQKLEELAKLIGVLRYATDCNDNRLALETIAQMRSIGRLLPARYKVEDLIEAAHIAGQKGQRLCELHIQRCYKLKAEEYADLVDLELKISQLRGGPEVGE